MASKWLKMERQRDSTEMPRQAFFDFAPPPRRSEEMEGPNSIEERTSYQDHKRVILHSFRQQQLDYVAHPHVVSTPRSTEGHNDFVRIWPVGGEVYDEVQRSIAGGRHHATRIGISAQNEATRRAPRKVTSKQRL